MYVEVINFISLSQPTPEERDLRTVLCMQLSPKMRERDLREFMSSVGLVRDVRVIADPRTKKCRGVAYVEFKSPESVALAIGLTGQKLLGIPIQVSIATGKNARAMKSSSVGTYEFFQKNCENNLMSKTGKRAVA